MAEKWKNIRTVAGNPCSYGVERSVFGCGFSAILGDFQEAFLLIYTKKINKKGNGTEEADIKIPIKKEYRFGGKVAFWVEGLPEEEFAYLYQVDGELRSDPAARAVTNHEEFGAREIERKNVRCIFPAMVKKDKAVEKPDIPFSDMILYKLHVRGYTMGRNSKVKAKGSFQGLTEKISYLKDLGITSILLMPAYEFTENPAKEKRMGTGRENHFASDVSDKQLEKLSDRINFWGYTSGYYYAPKQSYCSSGNAIAEFTDFVNAFHEAGLEVLMEFYFDDKMNPLLAIDVLRYWTLTYNVDGFRLIGNDALVNLAARDELLQDRKLIAQGFDQSLVENTKTKLASCNRDFMMNARCLLKGDENQISAFVWHHKLSSSQSGVINYIADHDGFTLYDLVSYNEKHNENNGEQNRDGSNENASWNCGAEGITRKTGINRLRLRQVKNGILLLALSQGVPMIYAGDEFGNSQEGNNNPWCQDNRIGWLDWNHSVKSEEIRNFLKDALDFRKKHGILHLNREVRDTDYLSYGLPELSYHSDRAWFPRLDAQSRSIGMLYCGAYAKKEDGQGDDDIYLAYNLDWQERDFALPQLSEKKSWHIELMTGRKGDITLAEEAQPSESKILTVPPRTILVLTGR